MKITIYFIMFFILIGIVSANEFVLYSDSKHIYGTDNGITYTLLYNASSTITENETITDICLSEDGKIIYALSTSTLPFISHLMSSNNYGFNWSIKEINYAKDLACSDSGQYLMIAYGNNTNPAIIGKSSDYGLTINTISMPSIGFPNGLTHISCDDTCGVVVAIGAAGSGGAYISSNYGVSFLAKNPLSSGTYSGVCSSFNGNRIYLAKAGGQIYANNLSSGINTWYVLGNVLPSSGIKFSCFGEYLNVYNYNTTLTLDASAPIITTHSQGFNNIFANRELTNMYAYNDTRIFLSVNDGVNWSEFYNASLTITALQVSKDNSNLSLTNESICIDSYNLCSNPYGLYCYVDDITYCGAGCINVSGIGQCNNTLCSDECKILGLTECSDITAFRSCGNYDTDPCLEYSVDYACLSGYYCNNGACVINNGTGLSSNPAFSVNLYIINSNSTTYSNDNVLRKVVVDTKNIIHIQKFSINVPISNTFTSRTCDYKETKTNIIQNDILNASKNYTLDIQGTTGVIEINITPQNLINTSIKVLDSVGVQQIELMLYRNISDKSLCVYQNDSLIYCDYSINSFDDLSQVGLKIILEMQSKTYTMSFLFDRAQDNIENTEPKAYGSSDYNNIEITTTNTTINQLNFYTITQPLGFKGTLVNNYEYWNCAYTKTGTYKVRTYLNRNGLPDFTNYYDYTVVISSIGATVLPSGDTNSLFEKLSTSTKYWIMLGASVFILIFMVILVASFGDAIAGVIVGLVMSMVTSLTLTILFGLTLLIPILYIIIGGATIAVLFRKVSMGV